MVLLSFNTFVIFGDEFLVEKYVVFDADVDVDVVLGTEEQVDLCRDCGFCLGFDSESVLQREFCCCTDCLCCLDRDGCLWVRLDQPDLLDDAFPRICGGTYAPPLPLNLSDILKHLLLYLIW